jgi:D-alanyl-D-alanine carboxypeptidase
MALPAGLRLRRRALALIVVIGGVAALSLPDRVQAAPAAPPALKQALDKLIADGVPGAFALERRGRRESRAAAGVADLKTMEPISATDRYRIGSVTKPFVSTVVLQFVAEQRLSLEDSVEQWLPGVVPNGDAITVRQLLNHTSGLYDYTDIPFYVQLLKKPLRAGVRWNSCEALSLTRPCSRPVRTGPTRTRTTSSSG